MAVKDHCFYTIDLAVMHLLSTTVNLASMLFIKYMYINYIGLHSSCHALVLLSTIIIHCSLQDEHYNLLHCYLAITGGRRRPTRGVTHTLGRNDRGVTPTGESFIPLTHTLLCMCVRTNICMHADMHALFNCTDVRIMHN